MKSVRNILVAILLAASSLHGSEDTEVTISAKSEKAIAKALEYLVKAQQPDGSWKGQYGKNVGETSLCIMAFMSMGNLPGEGKYGHIVAKGVNWIIKQAKPNGLIQFTQQSRQAAVMYGHALATLMLSEVWGQTRRKDVGEVLRKAIALIMQVQGPKGGWNYKSEPKDGDTSVCVMQLFALKSAYEAGIYVPAGVIQKALRLIKGRYDTKKKMFGYNSNRAQVGHQGSSAAGICIMHITGETHSKYTKEPRRQLIKMMADKKKKKHGHLYYLTYYGSVCNYYAGGADYRSWVKAMEKRVLATQRRDNSFGGGSPFRTAFAVLALALPYRYIPIYQH